MKSWLDKLHLTSCTVLAALRLKFLPVLSICFYRFEWNS